MPAIHVDPELILVGVLPPLLYSAAVALPAIEFRRDFGPIAGLSVLLVVLSSAALAVFFMVAIPGLSPYIAIGLGAILSPTDAVATSIVKRLGISRRVVTMLEGESLLNDATALVLLRTMLAADGGRVRRRGRGGSRRARIRAGVPVGRAGGRRGRRCRRLPQPEGACTVQPLRRQYRDRLRRARSSPSSPPSDWAGRGSWRPSSPAS